MTGADFNRGDFNRADLTGDDLSSPDLAGADFAGVDVDLLADYVGGALAGTPDEARVAALVAGEAAWRDAYALLKDGMAEVGDSLRSWGSVPEPMPAEMIARLDAALGETGGVGVASGSGMAAVRSNVVDLDNRRRRRARWGGSIAAAAAVVAVAGVGIAYLSSGSQSASDNASSAAGEARAAQQGLAQVAPGAVTSSNLDYDAARLRAGAVAPLSADAGGSTPSLAPGALKSSGRSTDGLADALARLRQEPALQECLDAIAEENGVGPITVQTVDYARFSGSPALIVQFTATNGQWAWASGPACGSTGHGAATTYRVQVG